LIYHRNSAKHTIKKSIFFSKKVKIGCYATTNWGFVSNFAQFAFSFLTISNFDKTLSMFFRKHPVLDLFEPLAKSLHVIYTYLASD